MSDPEPIHLYDSARAPNPRRVTLFMAEKGIVLPATNVNIMAGEHFDKAHRAKIGSHNVPALELEDGTVLTETVAICRYLEAFYPEPNLMGHTALEQARIEMWGRRIEFGFMMPVAFVLRHGNPAMAVLERSQCPEWAAMNRPKVEAALRWIEKILGKTPYIAGDRFTIADITTYVITDFMRAVKIRIPQEHTATQDWLSRVRARPAIANEG